MQASSGVLDPEADLELLQRAAHETSSAGSHCLVTPELFICGYVPTRIKAHLSRDFVQRIDAEAQRIARGLGEDRSRDLERQVSYRGGSSA